jgi:hypothetical protein
MDQILLLEQDITNQAFLRGMDAGRQDGLSTGKQLGLAKGFEIAKEIGFYLEMANNSNHRLAKQLTKQCQEFTGRNDQDGQSILRKAKATFGVIAKGEPMTRLIAQVDSTDASDLSF